MTTMKRSRVILAKGTQAGTFESAVATYQAEPPTYFCADRLRVAATDLRQCRHGVEATAHTQSRLGLCHALGSNQGRPFSHGLTQRPARHHSSARRPNA